MFEKEEEYIKPLSRSLKVAIISYNIQSNQLCANIEEKIFKEIKKKLEFIYMDNISNLYKSKKELYIEEKVKGLLNKKWMYNVMNVIPSVIIIHYKIIIGANKESEEKNIYQILEEIRSYSKTCIIIFILISEDMEENPYNFNIEDKTKPYCIKNYMHKNDFYIFQVEEIWNTNEFMNICKKIYLNSIEFYRKYKKKYKEKREKTKIREEKIDYDIKLGILSSIKSKENKIKKIKYFKEAYDLLSDKNFDKANYKYGATPIRNKYNFYEIRSIADWLFYKYFNIENLPFKDLIEIYKNHIFSFSNTNFYDNQEKDYFHFAEYYWQYTRYKNWSDLIENKINNEKINSKKKLIMLGMILFKQVYYIIKMIKFYKKYFCEKDFDLSSIKINGKKIDIKDVQQEENIFLGKPHIYYFLDKDKDKDKSNTIKIIENDLSDEIYIKKFISNNNINIKDFIDILKNAFFEKISKIFTKIKNEYSEKHKNSKNIVDIQGINLYINVLKIISLNNLEENGELLEVPEICDAILNIHKIFLNSTHIQKFTKLYIHFLKQYINLIQYKIKNEKNRDSLHPSENIDTNDYKTEMLINLSLLGNITKFNQEEENLFFDLLNDTQFEPKMQNNENKDIDKDNNKINIVLNYYNKRNICFFDYDNLSFNFNYSIKDLDKYQERKILDLVEYELKFNTSLSKGNIKFNSLKLFFKYINEEDPNEIKSELLVKEYNKNELDKYELGSNSNISILHKLLMKYKKGKVYLIKIMLRLCKKENINYLINIPYEFDKTIFLNGEDNYALEFKFPEKISTVGINQLFRFEYEINKKLINNIKIKNYKISFEGNYMPNSIIYSINKGKNNNDEAPVYNNIDDYLESNHNKNRLRKKVSGSHHIKKNKQEESSLNQFIFNNNKERRMSMKKRTSGSIPLPTFFYFNEEKNSIEEYKNFCEIEYDNFDSKLKAEKNKFDILIKFSEYETYKIKLNIKYTIQHEETGDVMEFKKESYFCFKVINPLVNTYNITSENYILYKKDKVSRFSKDYLTDTNIKINLKFNNLLQEDIIIKDIIVYLNEVLSSKNKIEINTTLKDIIENKDIEEQIKDEIFLIMKSSNYLIPFDLKFNTPFYGCVGKCKIIWTTRSLKEFQTNKNCQLGLNLYNENEFEFPNINVNLIELKYNYEKVITDEMIILNIKINNNSHMNKNLFIKVENNDENGSFISGLKKQKIFLKANEAIKFCLKIIPFQKGDLKLPNIIVAETNFAGKELLTNYYCPENILINN